MKASLKDHLTILMAFAAVFLCGYGIGHLVGARQPTPAITSADWEVESLSLLKHALELDPREKAIVEEEITATAAEIRNSRQKTILAYHHHLNDLYDRLISRLGEANAARLKAEKSEIEKQIRKLEAQ